MKLRALVLDDSRIMRNMVKKALIQTEIAEFEFVEGENGEDGLSKFNTQEIDIVFLDWNMPKMTGIEFVKKVRSNRDADHIPLIMITSIKTIDKVEMATNESGVDAFVSKPFTVNELKFKLSNALNKKSNNSKTSKDFFSNLAGSNNA